MSLGPFHLSGLAFHFEVLPRWLDGESEVAVA